MKILKNVLVYFIFPVIIIGMVYAVVQSVMEPVRFNEAKAAREAVGIQRLKDIRDLQVAFKGEYGRFSPTIDSLKDFYNNGKIKLVMQIGSQDDSVAVEHTNAIKKRNPRITSQQMYEMYLKGDRNLVFQIERDTLVRQTMFLNRPDFNVDSLAIVPFSGGDSVYMASAIKTVSGVKVPLFEASMTYKSLLRGLDRQLIINLNAEREDTGRYPGLKVGSIDAPNNNAGNWE
ncbi:MAG: hypothetical protein IAC23_03125 [Bacteroidetes bacterium]|uniref:Uncharacterized protein n=1 Tax=Candidatus Cryptobacteroides merdavium TaxID=2840769 RepID=A0A9D9EBR2_9BACT|nr:hypothetical protein [Candidatus Cryptobacteroides merdavium]